MELLSDDGAECKDRLQLPLVDVEDTPQTLETGENLLQLLLDSELVPQEEVRTENTPFVETYCRFILLVTALVIQYMKASIFQNKPS